MEFVCHCRRFDLCGSVGYGGQCTSAYHCKVVQRYLSCYAIMAIMALCLTVWIGPDVVLSASLFRFFGFRFLFVAKTGITFNVESRTVVYIYNNRVVSAPDFRVCCNFITLSPKGGFIGTSDGATGNVDKTRGDDTWEP